MRFSLPVSNRIADERRKPSSQSEYYTRIFTRRIITIQNDQVLIVISFNGHQRKLPQDTDGFTGKTRSRTASRLVCHMEKTVQYSSQVLGLTDAPYCSGARRRVKLRMAVLSVLELPPQSLSVHRRISARSPGSSTRVSAMDMRLRLHTSNELPLCTAVNQHG